LIATIGKKTKRREELEEAGYKSPTWALLRALQQMGPGITVARPSVVIMMILVSFTRSSSSHTGPVTSIKFSRNHLLESFGPETNPLSSLVACLARETGEGHMQPLASL